MAQPITTLSTPVRTALKGRDAIVFDGVCALCSGFFRFMLARDAGRFAFVIAQSDLGTAIYRDLGLPTEDFETNIIIVDGQIHQRLDAFAAAMSTLHWPWRGLSLARFVPEPLKSWAYFRIAHNRYRLFGRYDHCMMPTPKVKARFLDLPGAGAT